MHASILSIGDELLLGQNVDTNGAWLSAQLVGRSVVPGEHRTVGDDREGIAEAVGALAEGSDVLVLTGGLGPTADDLTREALGDAVAPGEPLVADPDAERDLRRWFAAHGRAVSTSNLRQTLRPASMRLLPNPNGTAPGLAGKLGECAIFALPGPPREMMPMFEAHVLPALGADAAEHVLTGTIHLFGLGESDAADRLGDLTDRDRRPRVGITFSAGIVTARILAVGAPAPAAEALEETAILVERGWAPYCYGRGAATLAGAVGTLLRESGLTLVTAESCTGGWLGKMIVDEIGSSDYYRGGWVTYANEAKIDCLGVPAALIEAHGAVSAPVARAMAAGALERGPGDCGLAITGVAGPAAAEDAGAKPPGMVFIAAARRGEPTPDVHVREFRFRGDRTAVRHRSALTALQLLRLMLLGEDAPLLWQAAK